MCVMRPGSLAVSLRCRDVASVASRWRGRRIENRFLWNRRDPFTNRSLFRPHSPTEPASVRRRAPVEAAAACRAARRNVWHLESQALSGSAPSPEDLPKN
jgi:hypothetical protein